MTQKNSDFLEENREDETLDDMEFDDLSDFLEEEYVDEEDCDDLTLLTAGDDLKEMEKEIIEKTFDATDEKLHEVLAFAEECLEEHGASMKAIMTITVALEEMFVNIAHYAYPEGPGQATVGMSFNDDTVEISLVDKGISFDPLKKEDPDVSAGVEERPIGGLGIFMVKQSMDSCEYRRVDDENHFIMRKKFR